MEWLLSRQERKEGAAALLRPLESLLLTLANEGTPASGGSISPGAQGWRWQPALPGWSRGRGRPRSTGPSFSLSCISILLSLSWSNPSSRRLWPRSRCLERGAARCGGLGIQEWGATRSSPHQLVSTGVGGTLPILVDPWAQK